MSDQGGNQQPPPEEKKADEKAQGGQSTSSEDELLRREWEPSEYTNKNSGRHGRETDIHTNLFGLKFQPQVIYMSLVEFDPPIPPERIRMRTAAFKRFGRHIREALGNFTYFNGTHVFSIDQLSENLNLAHPDGDQNISVSHFKEIEVDDSNSSQQVLMIVNMMVKKMLRKLKLIQFQDKYYYPTPHSIPNADLQMYTGFKCSVLPCDSGYQLCVDLCHRVMRNKSVRDIMDEMADDCKKRGLRFDDYKRLVKEEIEGSVVLAPYNQRIWRVTEVDFEKNVDSEFQKADGSSVSFRDYFSEKYEKQCRPPTWGMLVNRPKNKRTTKKETYLPPELCHLTGYTEKMRGDFRLMRALADRTRLPPHQRYSEVESLIQKIITNEDVKEALQDIPLTLNARPTPVKGRVMGAFSVKFKNSEFKLDKNKSFSTPVRNAGFITTGNNIPRVDNWAVVYDSKFERVAKKVGSTIKMLAKDQGASFGNPVYHVAQGGRGRRVQLWQEAVTAALKSNAQFVLYVLPFGDAALYSFCKSLSTVQAGKVSQCVDTNSFKNPKMLKPICGNIFKQVMVKLGHLPWTIELAKMQSHSEFKNPTMMVGLDVSHDAQSKQAFDRRRGIQSTVGFVATYTPYFAHYHSWVAFQPRGEECVREARSLMKKACQGFHAKNSVFPANVIVYRDGVGDSQLKTFVRSEISQYKEAFRELNISPKLTVIVVQKRLAHRFFAPCPSHSRRGRCPQRKCNGSESKHSPLPGTIVDTDLTDPKFHDFFLVPSGAPPGACARPTRFIVVKDDMKLSSDDIQIFTNQLTYFYFNWPGPIRVPAPCMYAHKIAFLFGKHVSHAPNSRLVSNLFYL